MYEFGVFYGVKVGQGMAAVLIGSAPVHIGDKLKYPDGKAVFIAGIGSGHISDCETDVLLTGEYDTSQDKLHLTDN